MCVKRIRIKKVNKILKIYFFQEKYFKKSNFFLLNTFFRSENQKKG